MRNRGNSYDTKSHLYHLIFNDALCMHDNHCNHNASDRASMYEIWLEDVAANDYPARYAKAEARYNKNVGVDTGALAAVTGYEVKENTLDEIDKYARDIVAKVYPQLEQDFLARGFPQ